MHGVSSFDKKAVQAQEGMVVSYCDLKKLSISVILRARRGALAHAREQVRKRACAWAGVVRVLGRSGAHARLRMVRGNWDGLKRGAGIKAHFVQAQQRPFGWIAL